MDILTPIQEYLGMAAEGAVLGAKFVGGLVYGLGLEASKMVLPIAAGLVPAAALEAIGTGPLYMLGMTGAGIVGATVLVASSPLWAGAALASSMAIGFIKLVNS